MTHVAELCSDCEKEYPPSRCHVECVRCAAACAARDEALRKLTAIQNIYDRWNRDQDGKGIDMRALFDIGDALRGHSL